MNSETKVSVLAISISILAVVFVGGQFLLQYQEHEITIRPIIVVDGFDRSSEILSFIYTNYGPVPNSKGEISIDVDRNNYSIERLRNNPDTKDPMQIVAPTQQIGHTIELSDYDLELTKSGAPLFIGILIEYEYQQKNYEYGVILKYSQSLKNFAMVESWIK